MLSGSCYFFRFAKNTNCLLVWTMQSCAWQYNIIQNLFNYVCAEIQFLLPDKYVSIFSPKERT